ncbi:hypothetical protein PHAMO_570035 [Magnetospirillum molischianum DSM 120]|uniref:Uncharacterized protein n=1 Tax=Magnetospirillum molischianum DSM 120 TaxID=1150626 RepID=H8FXF2_MAGML|nr:hypothetical protein PHAMO_570035 [Magnetospirillum molischianum DSM 120]
MRELRYFPRLPIDRGNKLLRRGARAVEWAGLENRCGGNLTVGSNPTPSANYFFSFAISTFGPNATGTEPS